MVYITQPENQLAHTRTNYQVIDHLFFFYHTREKIDYIEGQLTKQWLNKTTHTVLPMRYSKVRDTYNKPKLLTVGGNLSLMT